MLLVPSAVIALRFQLSWHPKPSQIKGCFLAERNNLKSLLFSRIRG